jgi:hypothetical protein
MTAKLSIVAQQYSSGNFASLRFHSRKQKIRLRFIYIYILFKNCVSLKLPNLKMRKPGSENGSALCFPYSLGTAT